jgi:hypothetical protein
VAEFDSCWKKGTFANPDITADRTDAVPLMWVFTYKFDEDGYLLKHKTRLVVRGDLQKQYGDTYVATLAARLFRALMALACAFNLKAMQCSCTSLSLRSVVRHESAVMARWHSSTTTRRSTPCLASKAAYKRNWPLHFPT